MKEVIIIGAGVVGCAVARYLSAYDCSLSVLEAGSDVATGASKANSGIIHAGFDAKPGTLKARYNLRGAGLTARLAKELDFPYFQNGAFVLAFNEEEASALRGLYERGAANGVKDLQLLSGEQVRAAYEPLVSKEVILALYAPTSAIAGPYEMTIALAENAAANGAHFIFGSRVTDIKKNGSGFEVFCTQKKYSADIVVNAAGINADEINNMICNSKLTIKPRRGEYMLCDRAGSIKTRHTLFQAPSKMGKGVLVSPTTHGNMIIGPSAEDIELKTDTVTTRGVLHEVFERARLSVPTLVRREIITQFSGLRAHSTGDDFVVGESGTAGFFNCAGIESPGLTSAPAIGEEIARQIGKKYSLPPREGFIKKRKGIDRFALMTDAQRRAAIKRNAAYGRIVCRCEEITEAEIIEAIRRVPGATDLDGVKRRTRAGMGRCQSGFCSPRILELLAEQLNIDPAAVTKCGGAGNILIGKNKEIGAKGKGGESK